jgi:hypothetical protein
MFSSPTRPTPSGLPARRRFALAARPTLLALVVWTGCDVFGPDETESRRDDLERGRSRWAAQGAAAYRYTYTKLCECIPGFTGPVSITVRGGSIDVLVPLAPGVVVPQEQWSAFDTVEELFALIESAIRDDAYRFEVEYDPRGFPAVVNLDIAAEIADDEMVIRVRDMEFLATQ